MNILTQKSSTQKEIDISKQEIINGIKEYDAVHELNKDEFNIMRRENLVKWLIVKKCLQNNEKL